MPLVRRIILALLTLAVALPVAGGQGMVICVDDSHVALELDHDNCGGEQHKSGAGLHASDGSCTDLTLGSVLNAGRIASSLATHHALIAVSIDLPRAEPAIPRSLTSREAAPPLPDLVPLSTIVLIV